jgi:hydrogenase/urease accessory protein HupE
MACLPGKRLYLLFCAVFLLLTAVPAHSHNLPMGGSKWCVGKNHIIANIDLNEALFNELPGMKERRGDLVSASDNQLQQLASELIQPYVSRKISVSVNGRSYPLHVDKLVRHENSSFTIWLSANKVAFDSPQNVLKIDYRMLFEETGNAHVNLAYFYRSDAVGDALQKVFDTSPAEGEYNFTGNAQSWELAVKGAAAPPSAAPAISVVQPASQPQVASADKQTAAKDAVQVVPQPVSRSAVAADKGEVGNMPPIAPASAPVPSTVAQNRQEQNVNGAAAANASPAKSTEDKRNGREASAWSSIGDFVLLGIEHILTGYDHIAFLVGLIVIGLSIREVVKIITAFTIAHSITLLLAALQIISLNSRFVESVIAVSICYIALENLFRKEVKYRWLITFCFGLVHGFGFASALQELIVGKTNLIFSVVSFNFGVEMGQLMIFFVLLPVLHLLKRKMEFRKVTAAVSLAIFLLGFTWLVERLFDLKLISS